jgi:hypothetical protein
MVPSAPALEAVAGAAARDAQFPAGLADPVAKHCRAPAAASPCRFGRSVEEWPSVGRCLLTPHGVPAWPTVLGGSPRTFG